MQEVLTELCSVIGDAIRFALPARATRKKQSNNLKID